MVTSMTMLFPTRCARASSSTIDERSSGIETTSTFSRNMTERRINELSNTLKSVEQFLPAKEIREFDPNRVTPRFDIKHIGDTNLSHLYDTLASTFWCSQRVEGHYASTKGASYNGIRRPPLKGSFDDALKATMPWVG